MIGRQSRTLPPTGGALLSQQLAFLNRTAGRILIFAAIFAVVRYLHQADSKPLVDILAVAIPAGVARELFRLHQAPSVDRATRRFGWFLGLAAAAGWAGGIWLERNASDRGEWITVCGITVVIVVAVFERIRSRAAKRQIRTAASGGPRAGDRGAAIRWMTLPALRATIAFVAFELIVVDWIGNLAAHRFGFEESYLMALTIIVCGSAGFVSRRLGGSSVLAGGAITSVEAIAWVLFGGLTPDLVPPELRSVAAVIVTIIGFVGGGMLGAIGGWVAGRSRHPPAPASS